MLKHKKRYLVKPYHFNTSQTLWEKYKLIQNMNIRVPQQGQLSVQYFILFILLNQDLWWFSIVLRQTSAGEPSTEGRPFYPQGHYTAP